MFLLPLFLLALTFFIFNIFRSSKTTQLPPGSTPWPVIGSIFQMVKMPHITLTNLAKTYGPVMSLKLGTKWLVVGSSSLAAIEILKTHDRILSGRDVPNAAPSKGLDLDKTSLGWRSECNSGWRYLRTLCRAELFAGKVLESQACLREKKVMELVEFLRSKEGQVVNIGELVFATVMNMLGNVLISKDMVNLEEEIEDGEIKSLVRGIVEVLSAPNISDLYPVLGKLDLQGLQKKSIDLVTKLCSNWEPILEIGVLVASYGEININWVGVIYQMGGVVGEALRLIFMEILVKRKGLKLNPISVMYYVSPCSALCLLVPWIFLEKPKMDERLTWSFHPIVLTLNCICTFALNLSVFLVISHTSALTIRVAGVVKDWVVVLLSALLFADTKLTLINLCGYAIAIAGVAAYNSHKLKKEATRVSSDESQATSSIPLVSSSTSNA